MTSINPRLFYKLNEKSIDSDRENYNISLKITRIDRFKNRAGLAFGIFVTSKFLREFSQQMAS